MEVKVFHVFLSTSWSFWPFFWLKFVSVCSPRLSLGQKKDLWKLCRLQKCGHGLVVGSDLLWMNKPNWGPELQMSADPHLSFLDSLMFVEMHYLHIGLHDCVILLSWNDGSINQDSHKNIYDFTFFFYKKLQHFLQMQQTVEMFDEANVSPSWWWKRDVGLHCKSEYSEAKLQHCEVK